MIYHCLIKVILKNLIYNVTASAADGTASLLCNTFTRLTNHRSLETFSKYMKNCRSLASQLRTMYTKMDVFLTMTVSETFQIISVFLFRELL